MPRSRLGPLAIESKLGDHPSQSSVWRAIHVQLKRAIAVKVFSSPFGGTPEARAAFAQEWETLKQFDHPAIVRCFGGGFEETDAYLAHELIEGDTLASQLERRSRLSWESVLDLAEPIADALKYLHQRGCVHGSIQPDKIIFAGLSPVLIDVRVDRVSTPFRTNRPPTPQEISLMPPELMRGPKRIVTAYGSLLARCDALFRAHRSTADPGDTIKEVSDNVVSEVPEPPASIVMDCPVWFNKLVMQLLAKDPAARPHGAPAVTAGAGRSPPSIDVAGRRGRACFGWIQPAERDRSKGAGRSENLAGTRRVRRGKKDSLTIPLGTTSRWC